MHKSSLRLDITRDLFNQRCFKLVLKHLLNAAMSVLASFFDIAPRTLLLAAVAILDLSARVPDISVGNAARARGWTSRPSWRISRAGYWPGAAVNDSLNFHLASSAASSVGFASITPTALRELVTELSLGVTAELTSRVSAASISVVENIIDEVHGGLGCGRAVGVFSAGIRSRRRCWTTTVWTGGWTAGWTAACGSTSRRGGRTSVTTALDAVELIHGPPADTVIRSPASQLIVDLNFAEVKQSTTDADVPSNAPPFFIVTVAGSAAAWWVRLTAVNRSFDILIAFILHILHRILRYTSRALIIEPSADVQFANIRRLLYTLSPGASE